MFKIESKCFRIEWLGDIYNFLSLYLSFIPILTEIHLNVHNMYYVYTMSVGVSLCASKWTGLHSKIIENPHQLANIQLRILFYIEHT